MTLFWKSRNGLIFFSFSLPSSNHNQQGVSSGSSGTVRLAGTPWFAHKQVNILISASASTSITT